MRSGSAGATCKMTGKWCARSTIFVCELASELLEVEDLPSSRLLPDVSERSLVEVLHVKLLISIPKRFSKSTRRLSSRCVQSDIE